MRTGLFEVVIKDITSAPKKKFVKKLSVMQRLPLPKWLHAGRSKINTV
jgi:hypothetical protein